MDRRRLLVVQYAGDYAETWHRLRAGGKETYHAQAYSDAAIATMAAGGIEVAVLVAITEKPYREVLAERLVAVGLGPLTNDVEGRAIAYAREFDPTHVLLRTPLQQLLRWACGDGRRVLLTLADSFQSGWRARWRSRRLARVINDRHVDWAANHGVAAAQALISIGVDARKVIAWDFPHPHTPAQYEPKTLSAGSRPFRLLFVGALVQAKGVGDAIDAVALAAQQGLDLRLDIVGDGDDFRPLVERLGIGDRIVFRGRLPNDTIVAEMRSADVVLVPSRKAYPEGFPLTIYHALCARTPLVVSDHPMFLPTLGDGRGAIVFRAGDPGDLSRALAELLRSPERYASLSVASLETWQRLQVPVKWADLVQAWLDPTPASRKWLEAHACPTRSARRGISSAQT